MFSIRQLFSLLLLLTLAACANEQPTEKLSGAAESLELWGKIRSYPDGKIYTSKWANAFAEMRSDINFRSGDPVEWEPLGPGNIGGRTLCLAFHPKEPNTIFAGSAGGGLWKSTTAGKGADAWEPVPTGFPVIGVGAIAIDEQNPNVMYIGTGEVYNYTAARPGVVNRLTRGIYGIGILKTTDAGASWSLVLDWSQSELTGVQDMKIDPENSNRIFAATTEGLLRSEDAGATWAIIHDEPMATDVELMPGNSDVIFVAHGGFLSPTTGVYRSEDGGQRFELLENGIPTVYTGKTRLAMSPDDPDVIYASMADVFTSKGLFKSTNGGDSWQRADGEDVAKWQGWYSHDVAVKTDDANTVINVGIDVHKSTTGGSNLVQKTFWSLWFFGYVPAGEPEGPPNYVHADIHAVYYHPADAEKVFVATDGGIFASEDGGETWAGRNGGYQTTQFYANFGNSTTDPDFAIGGMQDNSTAIYQGDSDWLRVLGGDGMSAAIDPEDDRYVYGSAQYLNLFRSNDRGESFEQIAPEGAGGSAAFSAPFELAPSNPAIIYAGTASLYRSDNRGLTWLPPNIPVDGNPILTIAIDPNDDNTLFVSTATFESNPAGFYKTTNAGQSWQPQTGFPDRIISDIAFHPFDSDIVFAVLSGFGTAHVYKTTDGGESWMPATNGIPDVPASSIFIDPQNPDNVYLGNDLGVFVSTDGGQNWASYTDPAWDAVMVMHVGASLSEDKLRIATHGKGVFEADLLSPTVTTEKVERIELAHQVFPNPTKNQATLSFSLSQKADVRISVFDTNGRLLQTKNLTNQNLGPQQLPLDLSNFPKGSYFYQLQATTAKQIWTANGSILKS